MNPKTFNLLLIISVFLFSCNEGWKGEYSDENIRVEFPQKPTESIETVKFLFGEVKFDVLNCKYTKYNSDLEFKLYQASFPEFSEDQLPELEKYSESDEGRLFRKMEKVNDLDNVYLASFDIVRNNLTDKELYAVRNLSYKGHLGKSYVFVRSKDDFMHRIDAYIIEDKLMFFSVQGKASKASIGVIENFFESFEVYGVEEFVSEEQTDEVVSEVPQEVFDTMTPPDIDFLMSAEHPYKPVKDGGGMLSDYGYVAIIAKFSIPPGINDPNRFYMHGLIDYQYDISQLDTFDLENFYYQYALMNSKSNGRVVIDTVHTVLGGLNAYEVVEKSRTGQEYYNYRLALSGRYLYIGQIMSNKNNFSNRQARQFFRSVRVRKVNQDS